ncbi:MAG: hemerythrin domain-containing protein [Coriobacteriia bacterium]|nr:hemerythrin domain-containing protein [Coriobacteriia bacterium]
MTPTECTADLRTEHRAVMAVLGVIEEMEQRFEEARSVPAEDMRDILEFLREFVDACHHAKEERMLFPAMREAGVAGAEDTIGLLIGEHVMGRNYVGRIAERLDRYEAGDVTVARELAGDLHGYAELLRRHIDTEEDVLFPMADEALPPEERRRLAEAYEEHERVTVGEGRHEEFHELIGGLRRKYLEPGASTETSRNEPLPRVP